MRFKGFVYAAAAVGLWQALAASASAAEIQWTSSYRDAKNQANDRSLLLMLDFYTDW